MVGARDRVIAVGDMKTITTTYGIQNRCPDKFGSFSETAGDFHTIGYCMEVISRLYESGGFFYVVGRVLNRDQIPLLLFRPCKQILNTCFSFPANGSSQRVMHERVHRFSYQNSACLTTLDCHVHQSSRHVILILYLDWVITCFGLRIKTFP